MKATVDSINEEGLYYALYCSLEQLRTISDEENTMTKLIGFLDRVLSKSRVEALKRVALLDNEFRTGMTASPGFYASPVQVWLSALCERLDKDLIVFFDEADCLMGQHYCHFCPN
jgi:hypothetical protein